MGCIQEGGVLTQKVTVTLGIIALLMMGAFLCCACTMDGSDADDETVATVNVVASSDFCGTGKTVTYTLSGDKYYYYYEAQLLNSSDESSGSLSPSSGTILDKNTITVTAPTESGDYRLVVKFYESDEKKETVLAEKTAPLKVVEPITLSFTLKNDGNSDVTFVPYYIIDGEKVTDSIPTEKFTISAHGTKDFTYNYYVKDVKDTTYTVQTDNEIIKSAISGLGEEKTFYAHDADYTVITTIVVVVLVIMAIILFFIMRKPVINKGKPKGRR